MIKTKTNLCSAAVRTRRFCDLSARTTVAAHREAQSLGGFRFGVVRFGFELWASNDEESCGTAAGANVYFSLSKSIPMH